MIANFDTIVKLIIIMKDYIKKNQANITEFGIYQIKILDPPSGKADFAESPALRYKGRLCVALSAIPHSSFLIRTPEGCKLRRDRKTCRITANPPFSLRCTSLQSSRSRLLADVH